VTVALFRSRTATLRPADSELIALTLAGDGAAYGALVERYQKKIYRVAFAILRDETEADLVTQDAFVQAYTHLGAFEGRSSFDTWATRIVINRSRDSLRRRKFVSLFSGSSDEETTGRLLEPVDGRPDPEREIMAVQLRAAIEAAVRKLSAQQKVIFRLRHYEDFSLEEIAKLLGLQSGTVRAHLFRAVHKIRTELADWVPRRPEGDREK
jgi:RNA polymerase sigma-70 factor (ECF subfamily)